MPLLLLVWQLELEGRSVGACDQRELHDGPSSVAGWVLVGTLSQCGWWFREESDSLAPTGDSWWLCQQTSPAPRRPAEAFISL